MTDIAVVIVTYKSALLSIAALRSLANERGRDGLQIRAIVVDNASGDLPTIIDAIAANDWTSWVTPLLAAKNGGFAYGNNVGIQYAYAQGTPDFVYLLNPDAEVRAGAITELVRFLESHPQVGIAGSSFENLDGSDWPIAFRFPSLLSELADGLELGVVSRALRRWVVARQMSKTAEPVDWICGASMLIRPAVFSAIGGLDENYFLYFEETDFCLRARNAGFATWYVPQSRVMHIAGQSTKVTEVSATPKRLPGYWFESRRRYYAVTFGTTQAMLIDLTALVAYSLGSLKRLAAGRTAVPHFVRDLARHSVLWPANRKFPTFRGFMPER